MGQGQHKYLDLASTTSLHPHRNPELLHNSTCLSGLSAEILESICDHLQATHLQALRLADKRFSDLAIPHLFRTPYFDHSKRTSSGLKRSVATQEFKILYENWYMSQKVFIQAAVTSNPGTVLQGSRMTAPLITSSNNTTRHTVAIEKANNTYSWTKTYFNFGKTCSLFFRIL